MNFPERSYDPLRIEKKKNYNGKVKMEIREKGLEDELPIIFKSYIMSRKLSRRNFFLEIKRHMWYLFCKNIKEV